MIRGSPLPHSAIRLLRASLTDAGFAPLCRALHIRPDTLARALNGAPLYAKTRARIFRALARGVLGQAP